MRDEGLDPRELVGLIKPTTHSNYGDVVNVLDEMKAKVHHRCHVNFQRPGI